jgi:LPXTG-motif cell wall-anchored protein
MTGRNFGRTIARLGAVAGVTGAAVLLPIAAGAVTYPNGGTPDVNPKATQPTSVLPATTSRSTLPLTGTDVVELAAIGGASAGVGVVLVRRARRTSTV